MTLRPGRIPWPGTFLIDETTMSQTTDTGIALLHGMPAIAEAMGLTPRQIRNLMEAEGLPTFRIGRTVCARPERIRNWLEKHEGKKDDARE